MQARRMAQRLIEADGAGLAATQVGVLRRMFVFRASPDEKVDVLVNPRVVAASTEQTTFLEGCLSFNTIGVAVVRPVAVRVRAQDLSGAVREIEGEGYLASLLQHEMDHLDGILTLDRADGQERSRAVAALLAGDAPALAA
jgi:peptide deformylase